MLKKSWKKPVKMKSGPGRKSAGSIPRAARILTCLSANINTVTDISKQCRYAKSTVHRILALLKESYLVTEDPTDKRYYIGPLITRLMGNPAVIHEYLIRCSEEEMKHLAIVSEETVTLDILQGIQSVPLYEVVSLHDIKVTDDHKKHRLVYTGASGKVLLSQLSDERLRIALKYINPVKVTPNTVTDKELLLSQILDIRQKGYAISFGEWIAGAVCISAPVLNYTSPVVLSIVGPEYRLKTRLESTLKELKASASRISRNILEIYGPHINN